MISIFSTNRRSACQMLGSTLAPDFVTEGGCSDLSAGKTGRGKTHVWLMAIAYRAIQNGFDALFTIAAAELIDELVGGVSQLASSPNVLASYLHASRLCWSSTNGERSEMWRSASGSRVTARIASQTLHITFP